MEREKLTALINRVIGKKGVLRTPSYWMQKVLHSVIDYADTASRKWVYELPDDGEYDISSPIGKKLIEVMSNPIRFRLGMWVQTALPPISTKSFVLLNISNPSYMAGIAFGAHECYDRAKAGDKLTLRYVNVFGYIKIEGDKIIVERTVEKYEIPVTEYTEI